MNRDNHRRMQDSERICFTLLNLAIFMGMIFSSSPCSSKESSPNSYQDCLSKARTAENRYQFDDALQWYQKALEIDDSDPKVHYAFVKQMIALKQYDKAEQELLRLVQKHPTYAQAYNLLGVFAQEMHDDHEQAKKYYRLAIQHNPDYSRPRYLLANLLISLQRHDEAQTLFEEMIEIKSDSMKAYEGLGQVLMKQGQFQEAIETLNQAIELNPHEPDAHRFLGQALARTGKREEAKAEMERYQNLKQEQNKLYGLLRTVRHTPEDSKAWIALGKLYFQRNQIDDAITCFQKGLKYDPDNSKVMLTLSLIFIKKENYKQAHVLLDKAIQFTPENASCFNALGICLMMEQNYKDAAAAFQKAMQLGMDNPEIRNNLTVAIQRLKQQEHNQ